MTFISQQILSEGGLTGNTIFASGETASRILSTDASKKITSLDTATYPSLTELSYVKGVTSSIQPQLNGFVPTARLINTTLPLSGGGNLTIDRTLTIMDAQADGSTKGAAAFTASDFNATSGIISIDYTNGQPSSSVNKGFLTSTDWNTFNNKVSTGRTINTTAPLLGGGNLSSDRTLSISDAAADSSTKGVATFQSSDFNSSSGLISIDYTNGQSASSSFKGFLTAADWTTFNNKTKEIYNYNTTGQTIGALAAHIVGTKLPLTNVKEGTTVTWKISVTKTAAGNAAPVWSIKVGSAGNNADTTFLTITSPPQTNTADTGYITIECIFRSGINTNSVLVSHLNLSHNSGTNGLANVISWDGWAQSSSNPFINPIHFISLSVAPGVLSNWTINQVSATMTNTQ